jgi:hypothetical protein
MGPGQYHERGLGQIMVSELRKSLIWKRKMADTMTLFDHGIGPPICAHFYHESGCFLWP